jgi:hypothetical protein
MTREELDTLWNRSVNESIKAGDSYARYRYAEYVAEAEREAEREACKQIAKEQAAQYKVGGALQMAMEKYSAQAAASACGHIAHLIEQRGSK